VLDDERASYKAYHMLVEAEYALGNYASAAAHARRAVADWPEDRQPYRALFAAYDAMGEQSRAEDALEVYVARHPDGRAAAYLSVAEAFWKDENPEKGRAFLERAIRAGTRRPDDHALIGALLAGKMNQLDRGIEYFERAVQLGSTDPEVHYIVGIARETKGEFDKAVECFETALRLDPSFEEARARLAALSTRPTTIDKRETDR
jgi:tetratricopeptide (TPR) repeat protein